MSLSALRAALEAGDLPRAVREGEAAIRADPASSEAQDLLGRAYGLTAQGSTLLEQMRLARKARACFARAVELDPSNVAALSDLARYDMRAPGMLGGGKKKARQIIDRVTALDPERGHVLLGELAELEKKPAEAEAEFRLALAAAPHGERGRGALSEFLVSQKRYGEARGLWLEARDSDANHALADYELAGIAIASGEGLEPAARGLEELLSSRAGSGTPTPASIHERLAVLYERLGRRREAAAELEAALTLRARPARLAAPARPSRTVSHGPAAHAVAEPPPGTFGGGRSPILELDGVRGLAILLVMLFHFQGTRPHLVPKALVYPMIVGWSGVDLFFVLSGFLITGILIDTRDSENYFSSFYARRVLRIVPLYLIAVFLCFRVALPLARRWGVDLDPDGSLEPWYWLHVSNWRSAFGRDVRPLSHFWSLSIEEQFYVVWPAFVLWTKPRRLGAACAALAVTACALRCFAAARGAPPEALHRLTVFRIDALAIGGLLAAVGRSATGPRDDPSPARTGMRDRRGGPRGPARRGPGRDLAADGPPRLHGLRPALCRPRVRGVRRSGLLALALPSAPPADPARVRAIQLRDVRVPLPDLGLPGVRVRGMVAVRVRADPGSGLARLGPLRNRSLLRGRTPVVEPPGEALPRAEAPLRCARAGGRRRVNAESVRARIAPADLGLGILAAVLVVRLWIMPLGSSLGLDEFGSWWVTDAGFGEILQRARLFPQSVPYAFLVAAVRAAAGASETALRMPSLLAMLAAIFGVFRLGEALFDRSTGFCAAAAFLVFPQIEFAAADARPYALAVLATVCAALSLVRWLDHGRLRDGVFYVLAAAATVYLQYLFATTLLAHAAYAWRRRGRSAVSRGSAAAAGAALALLLAPAAALVLEIRGNAAAHAYAPLPGVGELARTLVPVRGAALVLAGVFVAWAVRAARRLLREPPGAPTRNAWVLLAAGAAAPPVVLFSVSRWTGIAVFEGRYLLAAVPFWALILGRLVARIDPASGRRTVLAVALALTVGIRGELGHRAIAHGREDWRGAVAALNSVNGTSPAFLAGTFAESADPRLVADPRHAAYLGSPLAYYPTRGPASVLPLLPRSDGGVAADRPFGGANVPSRFAVIERRSRHPSWLPAIEQRLGPRGYAARKIWTSETLTVEEFAAAGS